MAHRLEGSRMFYTSAQFVWVEQVCGLYCDASLLLQHNSCVHSWKYMAALFFHAPTHVSLCSSLRAMQG
jgi:hypothetical protein